MVKKLNHKIFNLIIMICIGICLMSISSISYAQETKVIYGQDVETDYVPPDREDDAIEASSADKFWLRENNNDLFQDVRRNVAQWYYIFRYICIAVMLVILIVLGIKLAISSIAEQKAIYKRMLLDWVVCFILVFMAHYFMIFVQFLNENLIHIFQKVSDNLNLEYGLYETVRSRAYDVKFTVGFSGMILYMMLVWFTGKYVLIYAKRFITLVILTIMAPIIVLFYAVQKIFTGKSKTLAKWMGEYFTNTIMQAVHAMTYAVFVGMALKLSQTSLVGVILSFICLNFMSKADTMFRQIFKFFDGSSTAEEIAQSKLSDLKDDAMTAVGVASVASQLRKSTKNSISYNNGVWRDSLNSNKFGKKLLNINDAIQSAPGTAALLVGSKINGAFVHKGFERDLKREEKNEEFNTKIDSLDTNIASLQGRLERTKNRISLEQKEKFEKQLEALQKERAKLVKKQGNYNTKAGVFERLRVMLDPDTYLEYVVDEDTGDLVTNKKNRRKRRMVRKRIIYDAETNSYEVQGGFKERLKSAKDAVLNLSEDDKKVLRELTQVVKDGTIGAGAMILGVGAFADNPTLGFALLATGVGKTKKFVTVDDKGLKISRRKRKKIAKYYLNQTEKTKYTNAEFSSGAVANMDKAIRQLTNLDPSVEKMNRLYAQLESGRLGFAIPLIPFTLTGTKGGIRNILLRGTDVIRQHETNIKRYEISVYVEYAKALTKEILNECELVCENITTYMMHKNSARILLENQLKNGSAFVANGVLYGFNDPIVNGNLTREDKIRQAILQVAIKRKIYSLDKFKLDNKAINSELLKQLRTMGVVSDKDISTDTMVKQLLEGTDGVVGVKSILTDLSTNSPDFIKTKLFQSCVEEYAKTNPNIAGVDDLLSRAAQKSIITSFRNKYFYDSLGTQIQAEILNFAANSNKNISDLSANDIINRINTLNPSMLEKLDAKVKAKANGSTIEKEIEIKQKQIDSTISDMVIGVLVKNNIKDPASINFSILNDNIIQVIKSELLSLFSFAFKDANDFNVSEDVILKLLQDKIDSLSKEDIEKATINEICSKFISERCDGDISKLEDLEIRAELEQLIAEKLKDMAETQDEKDSYEEVIELLNGKSNSENGNDDTTSGNDIFSFEQESTANDPDEVADYPLPVVTAKCVDNKVICTFELPSGLEDGYTIATCKKTKSSSNENYIPNMEKIILNDIDEIACARLEKDGKHGQALVIKYPADAMKVANSFWKDVEKSEKTETRKRANAESKKVENIALNVFNSIKDSDGSFNPNDVFEDGENYSGITDRIFGEEAQKLKDPDIEMEMKEYEIRTATSRVLDVADMIRGKKVRMNNEDDKNKVLSMLDSALDESDALMGMRLSYDDTEEFEKYRNSVDTLVNKLLQMKIIDDDCDKIGIKTIPEKNKAFKKAKKQIKDGIESIDIDEIIDRWKGAN